MRRFTRDGPRRGRPSAWRRRSGRMTVPLVQELSTKTRWPFLSVSPTTRLRSTLSGKATSHPFPPSRSASTTLRSSPAAATTGMSHHAKSGGGQILVCVAGRGLYQEWGKPAQELCPGDVVNIARGRESTGTEPRPTAGSPISRWRFRARRPPTSGWSPWTTSNTLKRLTRKA